MTQAACILGVLVVAVPGCAHGTPLPASASPSAPATAVTGVPPTCLHAPYTPDDSLALPDAAVRVAMFDAVRTGIERLDGDGLVFRGARPEPWAVTTARVREEARMAGSLYDLGRAFRRLDATYPNLHTRVELRPALDERASCGPPHLPFAFRAARIDAAGVSDETVLTHVEASGFDGEAPRDGDVLVAINGRPVSVWARENLVFCEFPLSQQCASMFSDSFERELLGWTRHDPLVLTVQRGRTQWDAHPRVTLRVPSEAPADKPACGVSPVRYPGFHLSYAGRHVCVFESPQHPGVAVVRIRSFAYRSPGTVPTLAQETRALWDNYWSAHAAGITRLVLDVIDNHGGDAPVEYYRLLFQQPFQEQYAEYRVFPELSDPPILEDALWHSPSLRLWHDALVRDGTWTATPVGDYLPPVPQFCADDARDCREGRFTPRPNGFHGDVWVLVNPWCVSSCAGFVWELRDVLGARTVLYGQPDSGDTTYARITLAVRPDPTAPLGARGIRTEVVPRVAPAIPPGTSDPNRPWVRQVVSITRTTDAQGHVLSGVPQPVNWVPRAPGEPTERWAAEVLQAALAGP